MSSQGIFGALDQYWSIEEKPRLHRRNTYFNDHQVSNVDALRFGLGFIVVAMAIVVSWCLMGVVL